MNFINYEFSLLDIIFNHILYIFDFDNESILELLLHYKNGIPMSIKALEELVEQYNFSIKNSGMGYCYKKNIYIYNWISIKLLFRGIYVSSLLHWKFTVCKISCQ